MYSSIYGNLPVNSLSCFTDCWEKDNTGKELTEFQYLVNGDKWIVSVK